MGRARAWARRPPPSLTVAEFAPAAGARAGATRCVTELRPATPDRFGLEAEVRARRGSASLRRGRAPLGGPRRAVYAVLVAAALALACSDQNPRTLEDYIGRVDWFPTMRRQPSVKPYEEAPRPPVPGTLPLAAEPPMSLVEADRAALNPTPPTEASLARGKEVYDIFCTVCHGPEGSGGGNVATPTGFPAGLIPDLTTDRARKLSDGYLFGIIGNGRGLMPSYRRIPLAERWDLVNYVRGLQRQATAGPARPAAARSTDAALRAAAPAPRLPGGP